MCAHNNHYANLKAALFQVFCDILSTKRFRIQRLSTSKTDIPDAM